MGIASFVITSDGTHLLNPRHGKNTADALADTQRELTKFPRRRAANRTKRHRRAAAKVSRLNRKVARQRLDHAHKTALALVCENDLIAHENLRIANMVKIPAAKPDPEKPGTYLPNGRAAKAGLNHSISDAGWGVFLGILAHKAESAGRVVIPVNPRNTSHTCPDCGHVAAENRSRRHSGALSARSPSTPTWSGRRTSSGPGRPSTTPHRCRGKPAASAVGGVTSFALLRVAGVIRTEVGDLGRPAPRRACCLCPRAGWKIGAPADTHDRRGP